MLLVELLQLLRSGWAFVLGAPAELIAPGPGFLMTSELRCDRGIQWTARFVGLSWQQLQMTVRLAGSGLGTAIEKPETWRFGIDQRQLLPRLPNEEICPLQASIAAQLAGDEEPWPWRYQLSRRTQHLSLIHI